MMHVRHFAELEAIAVRVDKRLHFDVARHFNDVPFRRSALSDHLFLDALQVIDRERDYGILTRFDRFVRAFLGNAENRSPDLFLQLCPPKLLVELDEVKSTTPV